LAPLQQVRPGMVSTAEAAAPGLVRPALGLAAVRHLATLLTSALWLAPAHPALLPAPLLMSWLAPVAAHAAALTPRQLCCLFTALAQSGLRPRAEDMHALLRQVPAKLEALPLGGVSRVMVALAHLSFQPPPAWMAVVMPAAVRRVHAAGAGRQAAQDVSSLVWALAKLRVFMPKRVLHRWLKSVTAYALHPSALAALPPAACARLAWGLHTMLPGSLTWQKLQLLRAAARGAAHMGVDEALWVLHMASHWGAPLKHSDWRELLKRGVLAACAPGADELCATEWSLTARQAVVVLRAMSQPATQWARFWPVWHAAHRRIAAMLRRRGSSRGSRGSSQAGSGRVQQGVRRRLAGGRGALPPAVARALHASRPALRCRLRTPALALPVPGARLQPVRARTKGS